MSHKTLNLIGLIVTGLLAVLWLGLPDFTLWLFSIPAIGALIFLSRRIGALFVAEALGFWFAHRRNTPAQGLHLGFALTCAILAWSGIDAYAGHTAAGIVLVAAAAEIGLAVLFGFSALSRRTHRQMLHFTRMGHDFARLPLNPTWSRR